MLLGVKLEEAAAVASQDRRGGDHLCIEERVGGEAAQEVAAVAVGPVHHRCYADSAMLGQVAIRPVFACIYTGFRHSHSCRLYALICGFLPRRGHNEDTKPFAIRNVSTPNL